MSQKKFSQKLKDTLILSATLFMQGKQTLDQLIESLEETGMNDKEAKETAKELLTITEKYKKNFIKNITNEIEKKHNKAPKKDLEKILDEVIEDQQG